MMSGRDNKYPFTASQWQELEHQALIFKYMASGIPIPHDLILSIRRSFYMDSSPTPPAQLFHHQSNGRWGCFQMGLGRKAEDPEPWRCRRTDGKKWRCSKEAYPDSKYCERHMHRGKNRSRKPVETSIATNPSSLYPPNLSMAAAVAETHHAMGADTTPRHAGVGFTPRSSTPHSDVDACAFLESAGAGRDGPWRFTPLGMSSLGEGRQRSCYPTAEQGRGQQEKRQHCFVLGADVKPETEGEPRRPLLHFFDDWSGKSREPWMGSGEEQPGWGGFPKTHLSISIPMANHDLPVAGHLPGAGD